MIQYLVDVHVSLTLVTALFYPHHLLSDMHREKVMCFEKYVFFPTTAFRSAEFVLLRSFDAASSRACGAWCSCFQMPHAVECWALYVRGCKPLVRLFGSLVNFRSNIQLSNEPCCHSNGCPAQLSDHLQNLRPWTHNKLHGLTHSRMFYWCKWKPFCCFVVNIFPVWTAWLHSDLCIFLSAVDKS